MRQNLPLQKPNGHKDVDKENSGQTINLFGKTSVDMSPSTKLAKYTQKIENLNAGQSTPYFGKTDSDRPESKPQMVSPFID